MAGTRAAEAAATRASGERLRIARDLHDVLAHNISLISVQAGVALHVNEGLPAQPASARQAIRDASGEALEELRSALDALRQNEDAPRGALRPAWPGWTNSWRAPGRRDCRPWRSAPVRRWLFRWRRTWRPTG